MPDLAAIIEEATSKIALYDRVGCMKDGNPAVIVRAEIVARLLAVAKAAVEHAPQIEGFCVQAEAEARAPGGQQAGLDKSWASRVNPSVRRELLWYARDFRELLAAVRGEEKETKG